MSKRECLDCESFDIQNADDDGTYGFCKRYAPKPRLCIEGQEGHASEMRGVVWAMVEGNDWCSDFKKGA